MSTITNPFTYSPNTTILSAQINSSFSTIYNDYNGGITNANISASAAIAGSKLASPLVLSGKLQINNTTETGGQVSFDAAETNTPALRWGNTHGDDTDVAISTQDTASTCGVMLGANLYLNSSATVTRFDTGASASGIHMLNGEQIDLLTVKSDGTTYTVRVGTGSLWFDELAGGDVPGATANIAKIFAKDNGLGKTQLMVQFGSGAAQQISIEP